MKKMVSTSLAALLLATSVSAALAADLDNKGKENGKPEAKVEAKGKSTVTSDQTTEQTEEHTTETTKAPKNNDVQLKKELIELRQQLKHASEITADQKAKYEELVAELEKISDKQQALEVQFELLSRTYQKGDRKPFKKLGQLLAETGSTDVTAVVDGKLVEADVKPFIQGGRALVPVRAISAALKADVTWDANARTVLITRADRSITLYLDKKEATVDGKTVALDIAPVLKNGRVFLPLRFVSEQLEADVEWQEEGKVVIIDDIQPPVEPEKETDNTTSTTDTSSNS